MAIANPNPIGYIGVAIIKFKRDHICYSVIKSTVILDVGIPKIFSSTSHDSDN
jgi:hypothetical protein